ncbi:MAG: tetratricopeptide repeat protein [Oceanicaulis sp.]
MALFRRSFLTSCAVLALGAAAAAPASAGEVKDVLALPGGGVFVALDDTPASMTASAAAGRVTVSFEGWSGRPRTVEPYSEAGFSRLLVTADGFVLEGGFSGAQAELRRGGVLVHFGDGASHQGEAMAGAGASLDAAPGSASSRASIQALDPARGASAPGAHAGEPGANPGSAASLSQSRNSALQPDSEPDAAPQGAVSMPQSGAASQPDGEPTPYPSGDRAAAPDAGEAASQPAPGPCDAQASALADAPWDLDRLTDQADCLVEAGETRNATGLYERVLAFQPEHFRAALGLARLRQQSGRYADAARLFETAAGSAMTDGEALAASAAARRAREAGQD